jgi:hypothetical protein
LLALTRTTALARVVVVVVVVMDIMLSRAASV